MQLFLTILRENIRKLIASWCFRGIEREVSKKTWLCVKIPKFHLIFLYGNSPETLRKLCLSTKFPPQEIRWNFDISRGADKRKWRSIQKRRKQKYRKILINKAATRRIKVIRKALEAVKFSFCNRKFCNILSKDFSSSIILRLLKFQAIFPCSCTQH